MQREVTENAFSVRNSKWCWFLYLNKNVHIPLQ